MAAASAVTPLPGLWTVATKGQTAARTTDYKTKNVCLRAGSLAVLDPQYKSPVAFGDDCQRRDFKQTANGVSWRTVCTGKVPSEAVTNYVFDGPRHFTGTVQLSVNVHARPVVTSLAMDARRAGDCP